jgi:hypothetical protein
VYPNEEDLPPRLRYAAALDRRAQEVLESLLADEETMAQIRQGLAEFERGEPAIPLKQLQAEERARRARMGV